jgi:hypothetical protein
VVSRKTVVTIAVKSLRVIAGNINLMKIILENNAINKNILCTSILYNLLLIGRDVGDGT